MIFYNHLNMHNISRFIQSSWLVVFYVPLTGSSILRDGDPPPSHLLSLGKEVKLGFYNIPTRNRTPARHVAVYYTTAVQRQLYYIQSRHNLLHDVSIVKRFI